MYLEKLLKLLKQAGMHAYLDMHALPGGAVKQMGYTGTYTMLYGLTGVYILGMYQYYIWLSGYYMSICSGLHTLSAGVYRQVV